MKWNPHIHAVVSRGVWDHRDQWHPVPYVDPHAAELIDPLEFIARVLIHLPEPNKHLVRFYGTFANRPRALAS